MTTPSHWTSTYNNQYRDKRKFVSPHPAQPMYHFKGMYDPSHFDGGLPPAGRSPDTYYQPASRSLNPLTRSMPLPSGLPALHTHAKLSNTTNPLSRSVEYPSTGSRSVAASVTIPATSTRNLWNTPLVPINQAGTRDLSVLTRDIGEYWVAPHIDDSVYAPVKPVRRSASPPRNHYHVPGYMGFVRGEQFRHGDTFGKTTRQCMTVSPHVSLEP